MKTRYFSFVLLVLLSLNMYVQNPDFAVDENGVLTAYNGTGGEIIIPDGVISIAEKVFEQNLTLLW